MHMRMQSQNTSSCSSRRLASSSVREEEGIEEGIEGKSVLRGVDDRGATAAVVAGSIMIETLLPDVLDSLFRAAYWCATLIYIDVHNVPRWSRNVVLAMGCDC